MTLDDILAQLRRIFLDTAPVIYYVEKHPEYLPKVAPIFDQVDAGHLTAVTSPITLSECLVVPCRQGLVDLQQEFVELIVSGYGTEFVPIDQEIGEQAAELRARYNVTLPDALQLATALVAGCDAFLTNDASLQRITELRVLVLKSLQINGRGQPDELSSGSDS